MTGKNLITFLLILFAGTGSILTADLAFPATVEAKCRVPTFDAEYTYSAAVFVGEVIKARKEADKRFFVFSVKRFWKGVTAKEIELSVFENMRYQAQFEEGKTYLVFAKKNEDDGSLFDGRCSHSAEIGGYSSSLKVDLEKLGDAKTCINLAEPEASNEDN